MANSLLSAEVLDEVRLAVKERLSEFYAALEDAVMQDGRPALHQIASDRKQWEQLNAMRAAQSDRFYSDPRAMEDYQRLAKKYGNPPAHEPKMQVL